MYGLSIGTKTGDLEWPWTAKWPLFSVILRNLVVFGANCVKVVDKTITMDNLRILCLVVNVCRGTAQRPRYKFLADLCKFQRLNTQYFPSYRLDIGSRIWAFDWYQNRWPWMTLNGEMVVIVRYPTEFGSHVKLCLAVGLGDFWYWIWSLSWPVWSCLTVWSCIVLLVTKLHNNLIHRFVHWQYTEKKDNS